MSSRGVEVGGTIPSYHGITSGVPTYEPRLRADYHGLTVKEASLMDELARAGERSRPASPASSGLGDVALDRALARLVKLGYAARLDGDGDGDPGFSALGRLRP